MSNVDAQPPELLHEPPITSQAESLVERILALEAALATHLAELRGFSNEVLRHAIQELERSRKGILNPLRPFLNEILVIRDDLTRLISYYSQIQSVDPKDVVSNLDGLRTELDELLGRREIVPIRPIAERYDRDTQRAVQVLKAAHPDEDLAVVDEVRVGFHGPDGILRRTDVSIRRYTFPENP